ncbi:MAG TPA: hypothetical protein PLL09_14230 [Flavobacterium sp.]|uniref:hypothetical protein n=2 Tax=Flavobacterium TaxID=237 RepID=UPI0025C0B0FE|nr:MULTISPECIES: hypothetical protein [unclassified Flavobacterium]HRE78972.1 hypothetical protein [Flavobacterium sp.]
MLKFFRKIRFNQLKEGKFLNYLKYGVGEIILVVIGILIAVNINNYNEKRKQKNLQSSIFKIIEEEMISDTLTIHQSNESFTYLDSIYNRILSGKMTNEDYISCEVCANLVGMHNPHKFKNKGFKMLESYVESENKIKDSLSTDILTFYNQMDELMNVINEYSKDDVRENLKNWKENYDWFYLSHQERIKKNEYLAYLQSADFKNRIAMQQVLVIRNKKGMLDAFNKNAQIILPRIKRRINQD